MGGDRGNNQLENEQDYSLAKNRSRRERVDRHGKLAALERLKECKRTGEKYKPETLDEKKVYEEVDESEYSRIVQERQRDDWIIDDGSGYVEDGREIFDDDLYEEPGIKRPKNSKTSQPGVSRNPNIRAPHSKPSSIKSLFAAVAARPKKKQEITSNADDDILKSIVAEVQNSPDIIQPSPVRLKRPLKSSLGFQPPESSFLRVQPTLPDIMTSPVSFMEGSSSLKQQRYKTPKKLFGDKAGNDTRSQNDCSSQNLFEDDDEYAEMDLPTGGESYDAEVTQNKAEQMEVAMNDEEDELLVSSTMSWSETVSDMNQSSTGQQLSKGQIPFVTDHEGNEVLRMFWLDAFEEFFKHPGIVYLFGKVWVDSMKAYTSCCVIVKNIEKRIFILPRVQRKVNGVVTDQLVTMADVYQEFNATVATKFSINTFKSKKVSKHYAFEKENVPMESEYLEVRYSADQLSLSPDLQGETFSNIFGTTTSSLETFIIDRKLKGPCWLDIKRTQIPTSPSSWCSLEVSLAKLEDVSISVDQPSPPPLVVMSMSLQTFTNSAKENEILGVSMLINNQFSLDKAPPKIPYQQNFCAICKPNNCVFPFDLREKLKSKMNKVGVELIGSERSLLSLLVTKVHKFDPDIIVGHDITAFDLDVLIHRLQVGKVLNWSKIGKLRRTQQIKIGSGGASARNVMSLCAGRIVCDVQTSAKELIRCRSYDLTEMVSNILKEKRHEVEQINSIATVFSSSMNLVQLVTNGMNDAASIFRIMCELNILPLAMQITSICGNTMARTLIGGRSERNEYLLLHAFSERNFIIPDKIFGKNKNQANLDACGDGNTTSKKSKRKPAYIGGLVLEPKIGLYDHYILLLDFNSLYPSIIQEFNICFTTVDITRKSEGEDEEYNESLLPATGIEPGVLPTEIRKLVQSRKQVRDLMKAADHSPEVYAQYDIRQKALKLTANSMYGCLGFGSSRFYAKRLAALITGKGREILLKTKDLVQGMNIDVIYGDTDSIMVNTRLTDIEEVTKLGNKIKAEVNKRYRLLEIDIDGIFKSMLLLKKKKYAALSVHKMPDGTYQTKRDMKGLDIVRREWCPLAKEVGEYVLDQIFSGECRDTIVENVHEKLSQIAASVTGGEIPKEKFYITKQLTKNPEDYRDRDSLPHVQVAARLNSQGGKKLRSGDIIYYVICLNGKDEPATRRGYHPEELNKSDFLKIDTKYYLSQQIHPVVSRLCDPIDGTDACHIAEHLGWLTL